VRVAIIPARGGSRRVPRKNIRAFCGAPIIAYSIATAIRSGMFDEVYVSTDGADIGEIAEAHGARVLWRDDAHSRDECGTQAVMRFAISQLSPRPDYACCIYATVPMLTVGDLREGWRVLKKRVARFAFAVGAEPLRDAGMFYWGAAGAFGCVPLIGPESVMVPIPEARVCDINTEEDWMRAERMYAEWQRVAA
jgi:N-acylneuraminate cytidylyltransferase